MFYAHLLKSGMLVYVLVAWYICDNWIPKGHFN